MAVLQSLEELEVLLDDRPSETHTFKVAPNAAAEILETVRSLDYGLSIREMDAAEVKELAQYLEVAAEDFQGPLTVSDLGCSGCGRRLSILDLAKTGVDEGLHSKEMLAAVLTGNAGQWVTVRGKDGGRHANCSACGLRSGAPFETYATSFACPNYYVWA